MSSVLFLENVYKISKKNISPNILVSIDCVKEDVIFPLKCNIPYLYIYLNDFAKLNIIKRILVSSAQLK